MTLHEAAKIRDAEQLISLLDSGIDVNTKDKYGITPLWYAASSPSPEAEQVIRLLVERGADLNVTAPLSMNDTPLMNAAWYGKTEIVRLLIEHGANIHAENVFGETALSLAARHGNRDAIVALLLGAGAAMRIYDAAWLGDNESIQRLVREGADINEKVCDTAPIVAASMANQFGTVALLHQLGAQITTLHEAALIGDPEIIRELVSQGKGVNETEEDGVTALMSAAIFGRLEAIKTLIECGADFRRRDSDGYTARKWAEVRHQTQAANLLLSIEEGVN